MTIDPKPYLFVLFNHRHTHHDSFISQHSLTVKLIITNLLHAKSGKAYMFQHAMNIVLGPKYDKQLITGRFSIADVFCSKCGEELGWKYVQSYDLKNRYKEGKFILEELKMFQEY
ncbi:hypothetical protein ERO13_A11G015500v2 [Gossypium hirsutum]|uniref:Protein yippee-like n=4 Tax=Gossypium TaxID=3633 RepID=A0ABM2Z109_GOSHI|nr:protein yippee-like At4g27740 isoform X1 [Gossypium hirsutum]KAG4172723.1 hypothetical protein ERO13_A11G015500v2 [Gossypium hirsutum]TYH98736.1 hypothetical protein ES332_A11G018300v1 [Gossypium tomentosum]